MTINIAFADLTHTGQNIASISFPLGASMVASYTKRKLGDKIETEVFKYPEDFADCLENKNPKIACFSNYSWTLDLSHEFAKKIKEKSPRTIVVFGGPNYPLETSEQKKFFLSYPAIDFYIRGEGEKSFVELFENLENVEFNVEEFKENSSKSRGCHYILNGELIRWEFSPRIENLDEIPSPYLTGVLDKFFDGVLNPAIQTTRGCPFSCLYCQEGQDYFKKISRFSAKRIKDELEYIAERTNVPGLIIADSNFAMYPQDVETSRVLSAIKEKRNWPKYFEVSLGKNKKRVLEVLSILKENIILSAPVQSTDEGVLKKINRINVQQNQLVEIAKEGSSYGANSFSEIILALPGDSKETHFKSMVDMIDAEIDIVRSHQLLMLPGASISTEKIRREYNLESRFRIMPRCFGNYSVYGESFPACEIDELCVSNNTMTYEEYLKCRFFDLTVELFHNNKIFYEPVRLLKQNNILPSQFTKRVNEKIPQSKLKGLYDDFLKEAENSLWKDKLELERFIKKRDMIKKYIKEGLRSNEQLKCRAIAFFNKMPDLHNIAFDSIKELLRENSCLDKEREQYLTELKDFSLLRKRELLSLDTKEIKKFNYDFISLSEAGFEIDPRSYYYPKGIAIEFFQSEEQKQIISRYIQQYGLSPTGLGLILSRSNVNNFYRRIKKI